jgi:hypothetical protein
MVRQIEATTWKLSIKYLVKLNSLKIAMKLSLKISDFHFLNV